MNDHRDQGYRQAKRLRKDEDRLPLEGLNISAADFANQASKSNLKGTRAQALGNEFNLPARDRLAGPVILGARCGRSVMPAIHSSEKVVPSGHDGHAARRGVRRSKSSDHAKPVRR